MVKFEAYMPTEQIDNAHMGLELVWEFWDCVLSYKF